VQARQLPNEEIHNKSLASDRVATLSDGVFAIVLTLLVIELKAWKAPLPRSFGTHL